MNNHIYDVVIIGGGPAGYSAALYTSRAQLDTLVIEQMAPGGQMGLTDIIDNYPGYDEGIDGFTLGMKMQSGAERFGAKTIYETVASVDFSQKVKKVFLSNSVVWAKAVIIATGAEPRELGVEGEKDYIGLGIHYCAHCDGRFYKDKVVAVVGGGNSAASDALYLSNLAKKVYLVHRRDKLRATPIYHKPLFKCNNIEFLWNSTVVGFAASNRLETMIVENKITQEKKTIACDGVFVSIGRKPVTGFLGGCVELLDGYIVANESTVTNIRGVFAAGDVRTKELRQVVTAASDGATAAHYAQEYILSEF